MYVSLPLVDEVLLPTLTNNYEISIIFFLFSVNFPVVGGEAVLQLFY